MHRAVCIAFILLTISCISDTVMVSWNKEWSHNFKRNTKGHETEERQKRAMMTLGSAIARSILLKAKRLYSNGYDTVYIKRGGYKQAEEDFFSVHPRKVKELNRMETTGLVGQLRVTLRKDNVITISTFPDKNSAAIDKRIDEIIVYMD